MIKRYCDRCKKEIYKLGNPGGIYFSQDTFFAPSFGISEEDTIYRIVSVGSGVEVMDLVEERIKHWKPRDDPRFCEDCFDYIAVTSLRNKGYAIKKRKNENI
jgi:hypothetical protein